MDCTFDFIGLKLSSLKDFQDEALAINVIRKINEYGKDFIPEVYDIYEPLKKKCKPDDISNLVEVWMNDEHNRKNREYGYVAGRIFMEKRKGHKLDYHVSWEKDNQLRFNFFGMSAEIDFLKKKENFERFMSLCRDLIVLIEPVRGQITNMSFPDWGQPMNLRIRHPELNWMALFGKPYIDMFGRDNLLSTPCVKVETIGENVVALQLGQSVFESVSSEARARVKKHLGEDAFVEEGKWYRSYKSGRVPEFDFSGVLFDKTKPIVEPQIRLRNRGE